jgi:RepB DNA-primase from phage plasmid
LSSEIGSAEITQRITTANRIAGDDFQAWLRHRNAHGSDVYLGLNPLKEQARGRTKADVKEIRHLYLDLDEAGRNKLAAIQSDERIPPPNYVLATSPEKYQVVWRVSGMNQEEAESLLRSMAQLYGGDPAATDSTRVFRLPGFTNKKYEQNFRVTATRSPSAGDVYGRSDFEIERPPIQQANVAPPQRNPEPGLSDSNRSQSEHDWAYALRHLENGDAPAEIVRQIALYRSVDRYDPKNPSTIIAPKKPNPHYYAERTVARAASHLGLSQRSNGQSTSDTRDDSLHPDR